MSRRLSSGMNNENVISGVQGRVLRSHSHAVHGGLQKTTKQRAPLQNLTNQRKQQQILNGNWKDQSITESCNNQICTDDTKGNVEANSQVKTADSMHIDTPNKETTAEIADIDLLDVGYPEYCAEYAKDIYDYLHDVQLGHKVAENYIDTQQEDITLRMRSILIDWLVDVHLKFKLNQETLYLTVSILDRYLEKVNISRRKLQLVGVTSMLIASKFEEIYAPEVNDFVYVTDDAYTRDQILETERNILNVLEFRIATAYPLHFLRRASKVADADARTHTLAKYLMELTLPNDMILKHLPSKIAASALCLSRMMLLCGPWTEQITYYTKYTQEEIMDCVHEIFALAREAKDSNYKAIYNKYGHSRFHKISILADSQIENSYYA